MSKTNLKKPEYESKKSFSFLYGFLPLLPSFRIAQSETAPEGTRAIEFPDIPGYVTLKCDLHMHTVLVGRNRLAQYTGTGSCEGWPGCHLHH